MAYHVFMQPTDNHAGHEPHSPPRHGGLEAFRSPVIDRIQAGSEPGVWTLRGGQLVLPRVFGFCRGVERALAMAEQAADEHAAAAGGGQLVLLGEIIHNPWVNDYFRRRGVRILTTAQRDRLDQHIGPDDRAIIPAFGVPLPVERRVRRIGCGIIDCSCGDVIRLWRWSERAVGDGFGVMIFGRANHDETVVTKSRLAEASGRYLVLENLQQVEQFGRMVVARSPAGEFRRAFSDDATNAESIEPLLRLAQVSQTTMLYDNTTQVRRMLRRAFGERFGQDAAGRLRFQPTVCRATQDRQNAAVELCRSGCDVVIVVGGFESSNTRHLYELASQYAPAYLIENAQAVRSAEQITTFNAENHSARTADGWLPEKRPLRIGVLAGASSPEIVIGQVLQRLGEFLE